MTGISRRMLALLAIAAITAGCASSTESSDERPLGGHDSPVKRELPEGETLLLRTDFSDDDAWRATLDAVNRSYDLDELDLMYGLTVVDDPAFRAVTTAGLEELLGSQYYLFIVDERTIRDPERPLLAVDNSDHGDSGADLPTFRILPREIASVEVNLSLGNMDFEEFAAATDPDGVFRGHPR